MEITCKIKVWHYKKCDKRIKLWIERLADYITGIYRLFISQLVDASMNTAHYVYTIYLINNIFI